MPICVADDKLREQRQFLSISVPLVAPREPAAVPAIPQRHADGVRARHEQRGDVVGLVLEALVVRRPPRSEKLIAHATAIQLHLVEAQAGDVGSGRGDVAVHLDFRTQHGAWIRGRRVFLQVGSDPVRRPIGGAQQAHFPIGGCAPRGGTARVIPHTDLPVVALPRLERRTAIDPVNRGIGGHFPGIPQGTPLKGARLDRNADLVGRLDRTTS